MFQKMTDELFRDWKTMQVTFTLYKKKCCNVTTNELYSWQEGFLSFQRVQLISKEINLQRENPPQLDLMEDLQLSTDRDL